MKMDWRLTVRVISAFVFALALGVLSWLLYQSWENRQLNRELQSHRPGETADIGTDGILNSFRDLLSQNSDTIGWLTIDGTTIDYVVMHAPDEPDKYLHRDFYGNESRYGTLFVAEDYRGRGICGQLIDRANAYARACGFERVLVRRLLSSRAAESIRGKGDKPEGCG